MASTRLSPAILTTKRQAMIAMAGGKVGFENLNLWSHGLELRTLSLNHRKMGKGIGSSTLAMDGLSGRELVATLP